MLFDIFQQSLKSIQKVLPKNPRDGLQNDKNI